MQSYKINSLNRQFDASVGETSNLFEHCKKISNQNTSKDGAWEMNEFGIEDIYCLFVMLICAVPKLLVLYPLLFICLSIPVLLNKLLFNKLSRGSASWYFHVIAQIILGIPAILLISVSLIIDFISMFVFGIAYCMVTCKWKRYFENRKVIAPYRNGPSLLRHITDIVFVASSMTNRQGYFEFLKNYTMMFLLNPWIKYWVTGNEYVTTLKERFITQTGNGLQDVPLETVKTEFCKCISDIDLSRKDRESIDAAFFCPHYPKPHENKRYAIGMQMSNMTSTLVHTSHYDTEGQQMFSLSNTLDKPIYRIMLWYNNPFHIFTGYVEANISNMNRAIEHPMWLVCGTNNIASDRDKKWTMSTGFIDKYFHEYIPAIDTFVRRNAQKEINRT